MNKFLSLISQAVDAEIDEMCRKAGQISLGELEKTLELFDKSTPVRFDFDLALFPQRLSSYRGYCRFIAIEAGAMETEGGEQCNVGNLLSKVQAAIGMTFVGYKGGEFTMTRLTPVWASNYSVASGVGLVGVELVDNIVILKTKVINDCLSQRVREVI